MQVREKQDVMILGGGLAGLTLALQLKLAHSALRIQVLERRLEDAPVATHKVGESTSELGAFYYREVIQLGDYLSEHQLRKMGFRFFFSPEHSDDIARRVEVGSKFINPYPTHQIDRGILENELVKRAESQGIEVVMGARVKSVELDKSGHKFTFEKAGIEYTCGQYVGGGCDGKGWAFEKETRS